MTSLSLAFVYEGVHHKLKTMNDAHQATGSTISWKSVLWKIENQKSKRYEMLSIPRECDQTDILNTFAGILEENLNNSFILLFH